MLIDLKKTFRPSFNALIIAGILAALISSAVAVAYSVHLSRQSLQELQRLGRERDRLDIEWGQLLLEQHAWGAYGRIGNLATGNLGMLPPPPQSVVMVQP